MGRLIFITGAARSGKSRRAVELAQAWGSASVYVATYRVDPSDTEMTERIHRHRAERPDWRTLEAPDDIAAELLKLQPRPSGVILDCLTLWIGARFADTDANLVNSWEHQLQRLQGSPWPTVIVSNELGWSLVPPDASSRRFRDLAGTLAQRSATAADEVWLMVAGCPLQLK
jgi:adenosylcobinamide kinase / adenosylcobinamide-phosphate guanylyltransferase